MNKIIKFFENYILPIIIYGYITVSIILYWIDGSDVSNLDILVLAGLIYSYTHGK